MVNANKKWFYKKDKNHTPKKFNLLIVSDTYLPENNSVAQKVYNMVSDLETKTTVNLRICTPHTTKIVPRIFKLKNLKWFDLILNAKDIFNSSIEYYSPKVVHIETEGILGYVAKQFCEKHKIKYTTAFNNRIDTVLNTKYKIPKWIVNKYIRWFHTGAKHVFTNGSFESKQYLGSLGITNLKDYIEGINLDLFKPTNTLHSGERTLLYVGNVNIENQVINFCSIKKYKKIVVGSGNDLDRLKKLYPSVTFLENLSQIELSEIYNQADVLVMPSVNFINIKSCIEAMSCGLPIVAYKYARGVENIIINGKNGYLVEDFNKGVELCFYKYDQVSVGALKTSEKFDIKKTVHNFLMILKLIV